MGFVFSRLRKKKTRINQLDEVYQKFEELKLARGQCQSYEKSFVAYLIVVSFLMYLVGAAILYLYFRPSTWLDTAARLTPFVVFPIIVITIKWLLSSYFNHRRNKYDMRLRELGQRKKKLLDEVKECEPYNVVRQILEKYDPGSLPQMMPPPAQRGGEPGVRQRPAPPPGQHQQPSNPPRGPPGPPPGGAGRPPQPATQGPPPHHHSSGPRPPPPPPGPPAPRYVPPRDRGVMEKLVDYMIGDGPGRRYALICSTCFSHNGMALQDEFEYTSFRCAYCYTLNTSRKKLPTAPRLDRQTSQGSTTSVSTAAAAEVQKENGEGPPPPSPAADREGRMEPAQQETVIQQQQQLPEPTAATATPAQSTS